MKLREGFVFHNMGDEHLVVATGPAADRFSGLIRNNETADFLFRLLCRDVTEEELADALCGRYEVDRARALADVQALLAQLREAGVLDE